MRTCKLFDKYRDKELSSKEREQFEMHLANCEDCQAKRYLIENVAFVLKQDEAMVPPDLSGLIAHRAFSQRKGWDSLVISCLRPGPALATVTLALALFSFLWMTAGFQSTPVNYSEYEPVISESDALYLGASVLQTHTDTDLVLWLEQERYSQ
jgi:hypothetical protein